MTRGRAGAKQGNGVGNGSGGDAALEQAARAARARAYAPYSRFQVGAAVQTASGEVFTGANVENASYGLCVCAERNAVMAAVLAGHRDVRAVCVITDATPPASPCGMCRQVLLEFSRDPATTRVIALGAGGARAEWTVAELIPHGFTGAQLDVPPPAAPVRSRRGSTRRPGR
jgi:cytidine deaminase